MINKRVTLICIMCPIGCRLNINSENNMIIVTGNKCKRGENYAIEETNNPTRITTSTVILINGQLTRLPVKTDKPISKLLIYEIMIEINKFKAYAPIKLGDKIIENILGTDVNIIATRSIDVRKK